MGEVLFLNSISFTQYRSIRFRNTVFLTLSRQQLGGGNIIVLLQGTVHLHHHVAMAIIKTPCCEREKNRTYWTAFEYLCHFYIFDSLFNFQLKYICILISSDKNKVATLLVTFKPVRYLKNFTQEEHFACFCFVSNDLQTLR